VAREAARLEIKHDLEFQRAEWRFQLIGWWGLGAFVLAAALGVFGKGPLSHARAGEPGSALWIEYDRFVRVGMSSRIVVRAAAPPAGLQLHLNPEFLEAYRLEQVTPEPASIDTRAAGIDLRFASTGSGTGTFTIFIDVEPLGAGRQTTTVTSGDGSSARFWQLAYF
jgi:hypothetical protein